MFSFLDVFKTWQKIFPSFVNRLFDIAKQVNTSPNRLVRAVVRISFNFFSGRREREKNKDIFSQAVDCLCELELQYPGLLAQKVGWIYTLAQEETTHVFQNYLVLFVTVFKNFLPRAVSFKSSTLKSTLPCR